MPSTGSTREPDVNKIAKTFVAGAAIAHRRFAKMGAADGTVVQAAAASDAIIGVFDCPGGVETGDRVDVVIFGPTDVEFGGTVTRGAFLTSDANGKAVAASPAAGASARTGGITHVSAVAGDIMPVLVTAGSVTTPV
ncbi:MAG: hypothetical protein B7Y70_16095 [Rhizobiales bacterium 35-68-8]|nr:MAG: hypothetical protein B7Y70_16095 [Rhizobiales bacterium 35-68-8]